MVPPIYRILCSPKLGGGALGHWGAARQGLGWVKLFCIYTPSRMPAAVLQLGVRLLICAIVLLSCKLNFLHTVSLGTAQLLPHCIRLVPSMPLCNMYCKQECSADKEDFMCVRHRISP